MSRYRTATLPASYDFATNTTRTHASVCTDCGALVLDQNTHDTWHLRYALTNAAVLTTNDTLVLTPPTDMTPEGLDHLNDTLERHGIADRVLIFSSDLNPVIAPREPGPTERPPGLTSDTIAHNPPPCPDCGHSGLAHGPTGCQIGAGTGRMCDCHRTAW